MLEIASFLHQIQKTSKFSTLDTENKQVFYIRYRKQASFRHQIQKTCKLTFNISIILNKAYKWQKLSSPPKCTFSLCEFCFCYSRTLFPYALAVLNFNRENVRFQCFQKIRIKITKSRFARFCKFYANFLKTFQSHILPVSVQYRQGIRKQNSRVAQTKRTVQIYTQGWKVSLYLHV